MQENKAYMILKDNTVQGFLYGLRPVFAVDSGFEVIEITVETYVRLSY